MPRPSRQTLRLEEMIRDRDIWDNNHANNVANYIRNNAANIDPNYETDAGETLYDICEYNVIVSIELFKIGLSIETLRSYGVTFTPEVPFKKNKEFFDLLWDRGFPKNELIFQIASINASGSPQFKLNMVKYFFSKPDSAQYSRALSNENCHIVPPGTPVLIAFLNALDNEDDVAVIRELIKNGADPYANDNDGRNTFDWIAESHEIEMSVDTERRIIAELKKAPKPQAAAAPAPVVDARKWMGFTRADIAFTNEVFHQTVGRNLAIPNPGEVLFSSCPVCLKYIQHEVGSCMYMTHSCKEEAGADGYYHKKLWNDFKQTKTIYDALGRETGRKEVIEWCTLCGRICHEHAHYELSKVNGPKPNRIPSGEFFATDCSKHGIGGGGLPEKVARYRSFRAMVLFLNHPETIGKISYTQALDFLVEDMWQAPFWPRPMEVAYALREKKYNRMVSNTLFPLPVAEVKREYPNVVSTNVNAAVLVPVVYPKATDVMKNSTEHMSGDEDNIVQFKHRMADGSVNEHAGPNQQIALDGLMNYLNDLLTRKTSPDFGLCWQHADYFLTTLRDPAHVPPRCTARLYPAEVLAAIEGGVYEGADGEAKRAKHMTIYNAYRVAFNRKFAAAGGRLRSRRITRKNK